MIYEQLKADVAELARLESNRAFHFVHEEATNRAFGIVFLESPNFRIKIVCEGGWGYTDIAPLEEDRWVEASSVFVYLNKDLSSSYPYGRTPMPVQLTQINDLYDSISQIMKSQKLLCEVERLAKQRLEAFIANLRKPTTRSDQI